MFDIYTNQEDDEKDLIKKISEYGTLGHASTESVILGGDSEASPDGWENILKDALNQTAKVGDELAKELDNSPQIDLSQGLGAVNPNYEDSGASISLPTPGELLNSNMGKQAVEGYNKAEDIMSSLLSPLEGLPENVSIAQMPNKKSNLPPSNLLNKQSEFNKIDQIFEKDYGINKIVDKPKPSNIFERVSTQGNVNSPKVLPTGSPTLEPTLMQEMGKRAAQGLGVGVGAAAALPTINTGFGMLGKITGSVDRNQPLDLDTRLRQQDPSIQLNENLTQKISENPDFLYQSYTKAFEEEGVSGKIMSPEEVPSTIKLMSARGDFNRVNIPTEGGTKGLSMEDRSKLGDMVTVSQSFKELEKLEKEIDFQSLRAMGNLYEMKIIDGKLTIETPNVFKDPKIQRYQQLVKLSGNVLLKALQGSRASDQDAIRIFSTFYGQSGFGEDTMVQIAGSRRQKLLNDMSALNPQSQALIKTIIINPQIQPFIESKGGQIINGMVKLPVKVDGKTKYIVTPVEDFAEGLKRNGLKIDTNIIGD